MDGHDELRPSALLVRRSVDTMHIPLPEPHDATPVQNTPVTAPEIRPSTSDTGTPASPVHTRTRRFLSTTSSAWTSPSEPRTSISSTHSRASVDRPLPTFALSPRTLSRKSSVQDAQPELPRRSSFARPHHPDFPRRNSVRFGLVEEYGDRQRRSSRITDWQNDTPISPRTVVPPSFPTSRSIDYFGTDTPASDDSVTPPVTSISNRLSSEPVQKSKSTLSLQRPSLATSTHSSSFSAESSPQSPQSPHILLKSTSFSDIQLQQSPVENEINLNPNLGDIATRRKLSSPLALPKDSSPLATVPPKYIPPIPQQYAQAALLPAAKLAAMAPKASPSPSLDPRLNAETLGLAWADTSPTSYRKNSASIDPPTDSPLAAKPFKLSPISTTPGTPGKLKGLTQAEINEQLNKDIAAIRALAIDAQKTQKDDDVGSTTPLSEYRFPSPVVSDNSKFNKPGAVSMAMTSSLSKEADFSAHSSYASSIASDSEDAEIPPHRQEILDRLDKFLGPPPTFPKRKKNEAAPQLDPPPRKLIYHAPVLQVVNANTVKDRYLFLFNDILVIAKPLLVDDPKTGGPLPATLDTSFQVKSIVELKKLKVAVQKDEEEEEVVQPKKKHPVLIAFANKFAVDPKAAVKYLIAKGGVANDFSTTANVLFRNLDIGRAQLGEYLAQDDQKFILKAYVDRIRLHKVRIDDGIRLFLSTIRFPSELKNIEALLQMYCEQWVAANKSVTIDVQHVHKLVKSIMELNDALHCGLDDEPGTGGHYSFPNPAITSEDFVAAFRVKDPTKITNDEELARIYRDTRKDRIIPAWEKPHTVEAILKPPKLPTRLTYCSPSQTMYITIPAPDPKFSIKLQGYELEFEPPILTFAKSNTAEFRVIGLGLGLRVMHFVKLGQRASAYTGIPINKTFSVERSFMRHTFQVAFINHQRIKRKYLFSMDSSSQRDTWSTTLKSLNRPSAPLKHALQVSRAISLQVLRDALIPHEPIPTTSGKPGTSHSSHGARPPTATARSNSFSRTYAFGAGKKEGIPIESKKPVPSTPAPVLVSGEGQTGREILVTVEQNSLLPFVLDFVSLGLGADVAPASWRAEAERELISVL